MPAVHEDLLRIVADALCRGARAVAAFAHTRGPKAYPCGIVLASLGVLRDAFILSSVSSSPSSSSLARWRLAHGGYDEFVLWVEAHARSLIQTRADRRMGLSDNTSWLHEVEPAQVYLGLWQMKRYVALPLSEPLELRRVLQFTCRACISSSGSSIRAVGTSGGDIPADDDRLRMTHVDFAEVSSLDAVDLRVWQLLLLLGGQQSSVAVESGLSADDARGVTFAVSGRAPKRKHGGIDADVGQGSAPLLPGDLLYHGVFAGGDQARILRHTEEEPVPLCRLSSFEIVLWLSHFYRLVSALTRAPPGSRSSAALIEAADVSGLWRYAVYIRGVVVVVVRAWNNLARLYGFASIESMVSPYVLWCIDEVKYLPLSRPLDRRRFSGAVQKTNLTSGRCAISAAEAGQAEASERSPLADEQLRAVADKFLNHLFLCTKFDRLSEAYLIQRSGAPEAAGSVVPEKLPGFLTVADYRAGGWQVAATMLPPVLKNVVCGLTAFELVPGECTTGFGSDGEGGTVVAGDAVAADRIAGAAAEAAIPADGLALRRGAFVPERSSAATLATSSSPAQIECARRVVDDAMALVAKVYACNFSDVASLHQQHHLGGGLPAHTGASGCVKVDGLRTLPRFLAGRVQLLLNDPPYNTRRLSSMPNSDHDSLTAEQMKAAAEEFRVLLRPGGHLLIFCSFEQGQRWIDFLRALKDLGRKGKPTLPSFRVDSSPLVAVKDPHAFTTSRQSSTNFTNKVEFVIHATRAGASKEDAYRMVNYRNHNMVPSRFLAHDNVIENVRPPLYEEVVRLLDGSRTWMRGEQKPISFTLECIYRLSQPGDLVMDLFAGTLTTAAACLRAPLGQHRLSVSCDLDPMYILQKIDGRAAVLTHSGQCFNLMDTSIPANPGGVL